ncbi:MAG: hypothetical protein HQL99_03770 [Magnetococcales bacterium]|nr:hypothetical protein [Magnetococcales bacterium]
MPPWNNNYSDRMILLKQAVFWIAFDSYTGPTAEQLQGIKQAAARKAHGRDDFSFGGHSPEGLRAEAEEKAWRDLQNALLRGDITAKGRFSNQQIRQQWRVVNRDEAWEKHGASPVLVAMDHWMSGDADWRTGVLTFDQGQYIDTGVPEFIVSCLWPDPSLLVSSETLANRWQANRPALRNAPTAYLHLINKAVENFWVDGNEPKARKSEVVEWLRGHEVEGRPLSENLAQAIGTMILPARLRKGGIEKLRWNR